MTEKELRDKIADKVYEILRKSSKLQDGKRVLTLDINGINKVAERVAYSLIFLGIGDVSEYKHKAEVAERALRKAINMLHCYECDNDCDLNIYRTSQYCVEMWLQQAEKELQEKRKDE